MIIISGIIVVVLVIVSLLFTTGVARGWLIRNFRNVAVDEREDFKGNLTITRDLPYVNHGSELNKLDIILPEFVEKKLPVIINIHGGGLIGGDKSVNLAQSCYFAQQGYAVINLNYSLMPEVGFKALIQDIFAALHWLANNADNYPFDLSHVFMTGDSAGGMLVSLVAAIFHGSEELQTYYEVLFPTFKVKKFALTCPMVGTAVLVEPDNFINWVFHYILGRKHTRNKLAMKMADIYQLIDNRDYPQLFILTTESDRNFYYQAKRFTKFLTENKIPHNFKSYPSQGNKLDHVFNVSHPHWLESQEANKDIINFFSEK